MSGAAGGYDRDADRRIIEAGTSGRAPSAVELQSILEYVAGRGFDPLAREPVRAVMVGQIWGGHPLQRGDWLPTGPAHYIRHVLAGREWPGGTTYQ